MRLIKTIFHLPVIWIIIAWRSRGWLSWSNSTSPTRCSQWTNYFTHTTRVLVIILLRLMIVYIRFIIHHTIIATKWCSIIIAKMLNFSIKTNIFNIKYVNLPINYVHRGRTINTSIYHVISSVMIMKLLWTIRST